MPSSSFCLPLARFGLWLVAAWIGLAVGVGGESGGFPTAWPAALAQGSPLSAADPSGTGPATPEMDETLPSLDGPLAASQLLGLPVRTYGGAPPVAVVDDLLLKADGQVSKLVLDDGTFLKMGVDGKRVALPFAAAITVPGPDGGPAYLRINIAKAYGQVIREFLYDLIAPSDFALKAILGGPLAAADLPAIGQVVELWIRPQDGRAMLAEVELSPGAQTLSWRVRLPIEDLVLRRPGATDETRLSTPLSAQAVRTLPSAQEAPILSAPAVDGSTPGGTPHPGPTPTEPAVEATDPLFAPLVPPMRN